MQTILLIEDDAAFRYVLKRVLAGAGINVIAAADHQQALAHICGIQPIDLVLTDVVIADGLNGFALARIARSHRPEIKVIYMTGHDLPAAGSFGLILHKPIEAEDIVAAVLQMLSS